MFLVKAYQRILTMLLSLYTLVAITLEDPWPLLATPLLPKPQHLAVVVSTGLPKKHSRNLLVVDRSFFLSWFIMVDTSPQRPPRQLLAADLLTHREVLAGEGPELNMRTVAHLWVTAPLLNAVDLLVLDATAQKLSEPRRRSSCDYVTGPGICFIHKNRSQ